MLNDWMRDPVGLSMPSGVPDVSRMETGMSTVVLDVVSEPTVTTSCPKAEDTNSESTTHVAVHTRRSRFIAVLGRGEMVISVAGRARFSPGLVDGGPYLSGFRTRPPRGVV